MVLAYIGLGSNLGRRIENLKRAIKKLCQHKGIRVLVRSPYYETEPEPPELVQPRFINAVLAIETTLPPVELLALLQEIEKGLGRQRSQKWGARTIDLDILLFGQEVIKRDALEIPHPLMHRRRFVLRPLCDIAPEVLHPLLGKTARELLQGLEGQ